MDLTRSQRQPSPAYAATEPDYALAARTRAYRRQSQSARDFARDEGAAGDYLLRPYARSSEPSDSDAENYAPLAAHPVLPPQQQPQQQHRSVRFADGEWGSGMGAEAAGSRKRPRGDDAVGAGHAVFDVLGAPGAAPAPIPQRCAQYQQRTPRISRPTRFAHLSPSHVPPPKPQHQQLQQRQQQHQLVVGPPTLGAIADEADASVVAGAGVPEKVSVLLFCAPPGDVQVLLLQERDHTVLPAPCELCFAPRAGECAPMDVAKRGLAEERFDVLPNGNLNKELRDPSGRHVVLFVSVKEFDPKCISSSTRRYAWFSLGQFLRSLEQHKPPPFFQSLVQIPGFVEYLNNIFNISREPAQIPPGPLAPVIPNPGSAPKLTNEERGAQGVPLPQTTRIDSISAQRM